MDDLLKLEDLVFKSDLDIEINLVSGGFGNINIFMFDEIVFSLDKLPVRILVDKAIEFMENFDA